MRKKITCLLVIVGTLIIVIGECQTQPYRTTIDMQVPFLPTQIIVNRRPFIYYELHLTNFATDSIELNGLTIHDTSTSGLICKLTEVALALHFVVNGIVQKDKPLNLPPGKTGIIYIEASLPSANLKKIKLSHELHFSIIKENQTIHSAISGAIITVSKKEPIVLGQPLIGGPWAAIYNPLWSTGHRRVIYTVGGSARIPGRYAIDFVKLDNCGKFAAGDANITTNWYGYASPVLAVSDGIVVSVKVGFKESPTLSGYTSAPIEDATGNYISIKIAASCFVFYEHLKPGSIKVRPGQKVKKGDIIAALGFTGQTTGPHLHLHVADKNSPLGAEGIPFVFDHYKPVGIYYDFSNFGKVLWVPAASEKIISNECPASNSVVKFSQ